VIGRPGRAGKLSARMGWGCAGDWPRPRPGQSSAEFRRSFLRPPPSALRPPPSALRPPHSRQPIPDGRCRLRSKRAGTMGGAHILQAYLANVGVRRDPDQIVVNAMRASQVVQLAPETRQRVLSTVQQRQHRNDDMCRAGAHEDAVLG